MSYQWIRARRQSANLFRSCSRARNIHEFPGGLEKGKEFLTQYRDMHRDHGEVAEMFAVHSAVQWFDDSDTLNCEKRS